MANIITLNEVLYKGFTTRGDRKRIEANPKGFLKQDRVGITQVVPFMYYYAPTTPDKVGNYGAHQFGAAFGGSPETVVMPSRKRLEESGNPYPLDITTVENVGATETFCKPEYRNLVVFQYYVWELLSTGVSVTPYDLFDDLELVERAQVEIKRQLGKDYKFNRKSTRSNLFLYQCMHMLRDLEYCGLAIATKDGQRGVKTKFHMQQVVLEALNAYRDKEASKAAAKAAKAATKAADSDSVKAATPSKPKAAKAPSKLAKALAAITGNSDTTTTVEVVEPTKEVESATTLENIIQDIIDDKEFIKS